MSYNPANSLRAVKAKIDTPDKWMKGDFVPDGYKEGDECPHCLLGAIYASLIGDADIMHVEGFLKNRLPATIVRFNDDPETTHEMVMDFLDAAIADAEAKP